MKIINKGNYNIYYNYLDKFKRVRINVLFTHEISKEAVSLGLFLADLMSESMNEFKTVRELRRAKVDLYNLNASVSSSVLGNNHLIDFEINFLSDKYSSDGNTKRVIDFLYKLIFEPNVTDEGFVDNFSIIQNNLIDDVSSLSEQPSDYSVERAFNLLGDGPYSYVGLGYEEDFKKITPVDLHNFYKKVLKDYSVSVFITGDVKTEVLSEFDSFPFNKNQITNFYVDQVVGSEIICGSDTTNSNQSNLVMIYQLSDITNYDINVVLPLWNLIFGGGVSSKLFLNVREKHSLCYTVRSLTGIFNNVIYVTAGISLENYELARDLISHEFDEMISGGISDKEFNEAKLMFLSSLESANDSIGSIQSYMVNSLWVPNIPVDERTKLVEEVTIEEIIAFGNKINFKVDYILKGEGIDDKA